MKIRNLFGLIAAVTMCGMANAGEVDTASVTTFSSGTPAVASEVNGNFDALITAINDNAARIAALETLDNSVAGSTYTIFYAGSILAAEQDTDGSSADNTDLRDYGTVEEYAGKGTLTFDPAPGSSGSGEIGDTAGAELFVGDGGHLDIRIDGAETPQSITFSWTQTGNLVEVQITGETLALNFIVSEDGSMMVGQGTETGVDDRGMSSADFNDISTIILVRN